ncbi:hypothetical protein NX059_000943 [Plenodomus lindquistii]|nr:hypothetical protein NX059_000943 [Plenodomus lindquistii]
MTPITTYGELAAYAFDNFPEEFEKLPHASTYHFKIGNGQDPDSVMLWIGATSPSSPHNRAAFAIIDCEDYDCSKFVTADVTEIEKDNFHLREPFHGVFAMPIDQQASSCPYLALDVFIRYCFALHWRHEGFESFEKYGGDVGLRFEEACARLATSHRIARTGLDVDEQACWSKDAPSNDNQDVHHSTRSTTENSDETVELRDHLRHITLEFETLKKQSAAFETKVTEQICKLQQIVSELQAENVKIKGNLRNHVFKFRA